MKLENKKALITGGSRGIGKVIAEYFLKEGAKVLITARKKDELNKAKSDLSKISPSVEILVVDVSNPDEVKELVEETVKVLGGIDILVNAAGIYGPIGPSH